MDTGLLKGFAAGARVDLIKEVGARLDVVLAPGSVARAEAPGSVAALERAVGRDGREAVVDRVAYTWFNRIIALRFMDANGYTGVGVVSPEPGKLSGQPQVLSDAKGGDFDADVVSAKTQATVTALLNNTRPSTDPQGEAYGLLLEAYCRFWNKAMPFMFEREGDYTELLMPTALLATDSVRDRAVRTLTDEVCGEVEVIGWLYQFYISERKDEVFAGFKKNKKAGAAEIPAATQLFTPHWIVRYLVENSLGRLWLLNHPESQLAEQMDYYIPPVDEETDFLRVSSPEELKIIDPAVGSGHMLTYAFDLLYAIYEEQAYSPSEIPSKILEHNLYGAEIDPRAGALAAFALTMKAAEKRKLFLKNPVQPHICVLENVRFEQADLDYLWSLTSGSVVRSDADGFWNAFEHADTFGSLIQPSEALIPVLKPVVEQLETTGNLLAAPARRVLDQARQLAQRYSAVVANPPYMGVRNADARMNDFARAIYPASKADLFGMFIERAVRLLANGGYAGLITMQSWMFIKSFQRLRETLLGELSVTSMAHLGTGAFESISGEVVSTVAWVMSNQPGNRRATFVRAVDLRGTAKREEVRGAASGVRSERVFHVSVRDVLALPGSPMAYWLSPTVMRAFASQPSLGSKFAIKVGMQTSNNAKYLRFWWEPAVGSLGADDQVAPQYIEYAKGGPFRRWTGNLDSVLHFNKTPKHLLAQPNATVLPLDALERQKVTWTHMSPGPVSFRSLPTGTFHDIGSHAIYVDGDDHWWVLGYLNTRFVGGLIHALNPTVNIQTSDIARIPLFPIDRSAVGDLACRAVAISSLDQSTQETERSFDRLPILAGRGSLQARVNTEREVWRERLEDLTALEEQLEVLVGRATGMGVATASQGVTLYNADAAQLEWNRRVCGELVSFAVGCMFGRYSLDVPGLVLANQGDSLQEYLSKVPSPSFMPDADGVIPVVDGEWFEDDIVAKFRQCLRVAFGEEHFEENLKFVIDSLGVKDLRDYFVKSFYKDHVQRYKKRPIYWMFSSPKGSFNALVYLHRYNPSTVSTVLNEYLREFIKKLEVSLEQQERMIVSGANAREVAVAQKEAERLRKVLIELGDYERDLYKLASAQIDLDLDDGVLVNYQKFAAALKDIGLKKGGDSA